jgi:hypothetical protein
MEAVCTCPDPALCARLRKHIKGRLWRIWNGIDIDPTEAMKYRILWTRQAQEAGGQADAEGKSAGDALSGQALLRRCCGNS